jgi:hypothetical protein
MLKDIEKSGKAAMGMLIDRLDHGLYRRSFHRTPEHGRTPSYSFGAVLRSAAVRRKCPRTARLSPKGLVARYRVEQDGEWIAVGGTLLGREVNSWETVRPESDQKAPAWVHFASKPQAIVPFQTNLCDGRLFW